MPSMPEGIHYPGLAAIGNKLYVVGGFLIAGPAGGGLPAWVPTNSVWIFDLATSAWSKGAPLPPHAARTHGAARSALFIAAGWANGLCRFMRPECVCADSETAT